MRIRLLLLALATSLAAPVHAQTARLPAGCEDPAARRERPGDAARRTLREAIRDSLQAEITAAVRQTGVEEPAALIAIRASGPGGGSAEARVFQGNVADSVIHEVVVARSELLARWPEREPWLHVRLNGPHPPENARVECMPAMLNGPAFQRELGRIYAGERSQRGEVPRERMVLMLLVSREGEVVFGTVVRRGPGAGADRRVLDAARLLRFRPATVGGVPVDVWVQQPVHF